MIFQTKSDVWAELISAFSMFRSQFLRQYKLKELKVSFIASFHELFEMF